MPLSVRRPLRSVAVARVRPPATPPRRQAAGGRGELDRVARTGRTVGVHEPLEQTPVVGSPTVEGSRPGHACRKDAQHGAVAFEAEAVASGQPCRGTRSAPRGSRPPGTWQGNAMHPAHQPHDGVARPPVAEHRRKDVGIDRKVSRRQVERGGERDVVDVAAPCECAQRLRELVRGSVPNPRSPSVGERPSVWGRAMAVAGSVAPEIADDLAAGQGQPTGARRRPGPRCRR